MDFILQQWSNLQDLSKSNPVIAGAISLWGLGVLTFLCRNIPTNIFLLLKREFTTTLTMNNSQIGTNCESFANFLIWFEKNKWSKWSRSLSLNGRYYTESKGENGTVTGIGNGSHFFMYKGRPFVMTRTRLQNTSGTFAVIYEIEITGLTRNRKIILDMISEFVYDPPSNKLSICSYRDGWVKVSDVNHRSLSTVIIDSKIKQSIINNITRFKQSRQWYLDRGLSYKLIFVLHGEPGSGKSSFIKALASHFGSGISLLSLEDIKGSHLSSALSDNPRGNFILIEDFDSAKATKARKPKKKINRQNIDDIIGLKNNEQPIIDVNVGSTVSLSFILNELNGVVSLDDTIIFMTTNVLEDIDPAILRPGRVDHVYELGKLRHKEVCEYINLMFPGSTFDSEHFEDIMGCDLQKLYFEHRDSLKDFVASIPKK